MKELEIEKNIKDSVEKILNGFSNKLLNKQISFDIEVNKSGEGKDYFSEIEVTFWQNNNVLDVISIIIYSQGELKDTKDRFLKWFNEEVSKIIT
jgi:hypothetical protein